MLQIAILEDNSSDAARLTDYLRRYETNLKGAQTFKIEHTADCLAFLDNYKPDYDILFFDIEMPHLNGMEAAKKIYRTDKDAIIIFVTNLEQYAIQGYQIDALGYLLKPLTYHRLADIMDKALRRLATRNDLQITLLNGENVMRLPVADIFYLEVTGHILTYHTTYGEFQMRGKLSDKEAELALHGFARCNKGYLINLQHVKAISKGIVTVGKDELLISRGKQKAFMERYLQWLSEHNT